MNSLSRLLTVAVAAFSLDLAVAQPPSADLAVGQEICTAGYVMDRYCIDLGYLLDSPSTNTLENPEKHSVHCLVDVTPCLQSTFHILQDPACPGDKYGTGWGVSSNERLLTDARTVGSCSTCNGGSLKKGYRAEVMGTVVTVDPPVLEVTSVSYLADGAAGCPNVVVPAANCTGGGGGGASSSSDPSSGAVIHQKGLATIMSFFLVLAGTVLL